MRAEDAGIDKLAESLARPYIYLSSPAKMSWPMEQHDPIRGFFPPKRLVRLVRKKVLSNPVKLEVNCRGNAHTVVIGRTGAVHLGHTKDELNALRAIQTLGQPSPCLELLEIVKGSVRCTETLRPQLMRPAQSGSP